MNRDLGPGPLVISLALAMAACFAIWAAFSNVPAYEEQANKTYKEKILLKSRAMKTIVVVNGKEREDCTLQRGAKAIYCKPPLTEEAKKAQRKKGK